MCVYDALPGRRRRFKPRRRQLNSLLGKLTWAAALVRGGRLFLNELRRCVLAARRAHHRVRLTPTACRELRWLVGWFFTLGEPMVRLKS